MPGGRYASADDEIAVDAAGTVRSTNRGGLEGGVTTGEPIACAAMKPISTTLTPPMSIDLATGRPADPLRAIGLLRGPAQVVIGQAMAAWVLADALMEKLGGI